MSNLWNDIFFENLEELKKEPTGEESSYKDIIAEYLELNNNENEI